MRMAGIAVVTEQSKNIELLTISDNCSTRIILVYPTGAPQEKKIQLFFKYSSGNIYMLSINKSKGDITIRQLCKQQPLIKSWNADCVTEGSKLAHDFTRLFQRTGMKEMTVTCRSHSKFTAEDWREFERRCKEGSLYIECTLSRFFESGRAFMKRLLVGPPVKQFISFPSMDVWWHILIAAMMQKYVVQSRGHYDLTAVSVGSATATYT